MLLKFPAKLFAIAVLCLIGSVSSANAQAVLNDPSDYEQYDNRATIAVDGWIVDAPNTVTIKMRRITTGTIQDSASVGVPDQDGTGQGSFSVNLDPPELTGWPEGYYAIELWENGAIQAEVTIQIVGS